MSSTRKSFLLGALSGVLVTGAAAFMVGAGRPLAGEMFVTGDGHNAYLWSASGGKLTFLDAAQAAKGHDDEKGKKEDEKGKDEGKGKGKGKG